MTGMAKKSQEDLIHELTNVLRKIEVVQNATEKENITSDKAKEFYEVFLVEVGELADLQTQCEFEDKELEAKVLRLIETTKDTLKTHLS